VARLTHAANLGWIRPPLVYASAVMAGALLTWLWPLPFVLPAAVPIGATMVLAAIVLFVLSVRALQAAGTPVPGDRPTTAIVRTGPYRFSRNPIYLAFSLLQLGIAGMVNSLWLFVTLVPAVALMSFVVIPREERYLEARFPTQYMPYKAAVRRWL
jgi:protein-S-isoprenylcysteine O-methyltransferase Ste14